MKNFVVSTITLLLSLSTAAQHCDTLEVKGDRQLVADLVLQLSQRDDAKVLIENKEYGIDTFYNYFVGQDTLWVRVPPSPRIVTDNQLGHISKYVLCSNGGKVRKIGVLYESFNELTGEFLEEKFFGWIIFNE